MPASASRPLRILIIGGKWPPEAFLVRRLQGLVRSGMRVTVAANGGGPNFQLEGVRFLRLPVSEKERVRSALVLLLGLLAGLVAAPRRTARFWTSTAGWRGRERVWKLMEMIPFALERPDCIHFEWNFAAVHYLPLFDLMRCPSVVSCRGTQLLVAPHIPHRSEQTAALPLTFAKATVVHCVSNAVARAAVQLGAEPEKIRVFRPAVEQELFRPVERSSEVDEGPFRIIMTFTLGWVKGYEYALQALRRLRDDGIQAHLTIVGGGDKTNRQRLLYTIHDLALSACVSLPGALKPADVVTQLQSSGVYLMSSVSEGISNAVLEAMSCGLPVVCTACPGMEEVITDGREGFLVPVRDPAAMAQRLGELAQSAELRRKMGALGRQRVLEGFQHARLITEWARVYGEICNDSSSGRAATGTPRPTAGAIGEG